MKNVLPSTESLQTTNTVVMVAPNDFGFNEETAGTNTFQSKIDTNSPLHEIAMEEFTHAVHSLADAGIEVITMQSRKDIVTPDAVFPNNWFSLHQNDGERTFVLYPMLAQNRREERRPEKLQKKLADIGIGIDRTIDLTHFEEQDKALEGTGSLVIDRDNNIVYASLSPRTNSEPLHEFCSKLGMSPIIFESDPIDETAIYHTNVIMSVGTRFAVVAADIIKGSQQRSKVLNSLAETGKEVVTITKDQVLGMCGNIIELQSTDGEPVILMSQSAFDTFEPEQLKQLERHGKFIVVNIPTIETVGGGSARCMVSEVF